MRTFPGHTGFVEALAFSPDGRTFATASADGTARLWDVLGTTRGKVFHNASQEQLGAVAFSPNGRWLAIGDYHGHICVYDSKSLAQVRDWEGRGRVVGLAFAPSGKFLAWASYTEVGWCHFPGDGEPHLIRERVVKPFSLTISPDSEMLAIGHQADHFTLCRQDTMQPKSYTHGQERGCWSLAYSPDGRTLALALGEGVQLWDVERRRLRVELKGDEDVVAGVAYSSDGRRLATCSWDGVARLYDVKTPAPRLIESYDWRMGRLFCVAFSPDGTLAVVGGDRADYLLAWDVE